MPESCPPESRRERLLILRQGTVNNTIDSIHPRQVTSVVCHEKGCRLAFPHHPDDQIHDSGTALLIERTRGLVDHEKLRIVHQCSREIDALSLPARQLGRPFSALIREPDSVQQIHRF